MRRTATVFAVVACALGAIVSPAAAADRYADAGDDAAMTQSPAGAVLAGRKTLQDSTKGEPSEPYFTDDNPIGARDDHTYDGPVAAGVQPAAFKCRQMQRGSSFGFAHEWVHMSKAANCNTILMGDTVTEAQWSDIVQQAYKLQNNMEYNPHTHHSKKFKVNHKLISTAFLWRRYLAPRARHLQETDPQAWAKTKDDLAAQGCPLFSDTELPDGLHPAWWADVGLTANKIFDVKAKMGTAPSGKVVGDIVLSTMFEPAEGVLSWDTFRWYKGDTRCTPMIKAPLEDGGMAEYTTALEVSSAITAIWLAWCSVRPGEQGVGACAGDFVANETPAGWESSHWGFTYNPSAL